MKINKFNSIDCMSNQLALDFAELADKNIAEKGFFSVVLSGGNTPESLFIELAELAKNQKKSSGIKSFSFGEMNGVYL